MRKELLNLIPKSFLCPCCGEWHSWPYYKKLGYFDSFREAALKCSYGESTDTTYKICIYNGYLYYSTEPTCGRTVQTVAGKIPISYIDEDTEKPMVTFKVKIAPDMDVKCRNCDLNFHCSNARLGENDITLGFEFDEFDYFNTSHEQLEEQSLQECEETLRNEKLKQQAEESAQQVKEDITMTNNNIINMNMEFGQLKDENIASTLMGVAVKSGNSWRIYDKKRCEIIDVGSMQLGDFPIFILPATKLKVGDLIKNDGEYYFVINIEKGNTKTLSAKTGEMKTVIPIKNVLGFSCYSKVVALDLINVGDDLTGEGFDVEKMAIMSAMCGQTGDNNGQMNQLLPLMLMSGGKENDDDMMQLMLMSSMMSTTAENGGQNMNQLLPLMLMKEKKGDNDMMKLMLMSSMMSTMAENGGQNMNQLLPLMLLKEKKGDEDMKEEQNMNQLHPFTRLKKENDDEDMKEEHNED